MKIVVYLHTAEIDQLGAIALRRLESGQCLLRGRGKYRFSLDIHGIGVQLALAARLGQADGVENSLRHAIFARGGLDFPFTGT
ncbi:hypothetical protein D3C80_1605270 [compost metagenome]